MNNEEFFLSFLASINILRHNFPKSQILIENGISGDSDYFWIRIHNEGNNRDDNGNGLYNQKLQKLSIVKSPTWVEVFKLAMIEAQKNTEQMLESMDEEEMQREIDNRLLLDHELSLENSG